MDDAFTKYLKNQLENPAFRRAWELLGPNHLRKLRESEKNIQQHADNAEQKDNH